MWIAGRCRVQQTGCALQGIQLLVPESGVVTARTALLHMVKSRTLKHSAGAVWWLDMLSCMIRDSVLGGKQV